jgi:hypothetical protein
VTEFVEIQSPCYNDNSIGKVILFPFTYSNGVLDIALIDNFQARMITLSGRSPDNQPDYLVKLLGGTGVVTSIGDNFKNYIRSWKTEDISLTDIVVDSPITVFKPATVTRVQMCGISTNDAYEESSVPPSNNYTIGSPANNYRSVWVFDTPLTISYKNAGNQDRYITLYSKFDED